MSVEKKLNKPILLQGNLPKTQNECVVEDSFLTITINLLEILLKLKQRKQK